MRITERTVDQHAPTMRPLAVLSSLLVCLSAPAFFMFEQLVIGAILAVAGLAIAAADWRRHPALLRDLLLIVIGIGIVRSIPLAAELDNVAILRFAVALGGAVAVPYALSRWLYREPSIRFPWRGDRKPWSPWQWAWLALVVFLAWAILPWYFISSGVYTNWPVIDSSETMARLFIGVGVVGIWDELFFICVVFTLLRRHLPTWLANGLQAIVFVSFLWELGYQSWGPALTIPFALVQGLIFTHTRSLGYVVTVHLIFDAVVFAVLVHANNPELFAIFLTTSG